MRLFHFYSFWACTPLIFLQFVDARSEARDAIKHIFPVESPVINTPSHQVNHRSHFDLTFSLHNKRQQLKLSLEPSDDIIGETAHIEYFDGQGNIKHSEPIDRPAHMVFKGSAWIQQVDGSWARAGWARIYMRRGGPNPLMEGAFSIMGDSHHVQLQSTYIQTRHDSDFRFNKKADEHMIIHRDSDTALHTSNRGLKRGSSVSLGCETDKLSFNSDPNHPILASNFEQATTHGSSKLLRHVAAPGKRQSDTGGNIGAVDLQSTIGNTNGCPTTRRVAMIGIATDCSYTASFDSVESVRQNIISMVNTASDVYERTFNITIGIQNLTISDAECPNTAPESAPWNMPCSTGSMSRRLDLFSRWSASRGDDNAYWTLLSTCSSGRTVGIAWLGQLCVSELFGSRSQSVTGANVVVRTPNEWQIFAHESGHTFGAVHDCDSSSCQTSSSFQCCPVSSSGCDARGQYIMSPALASSITEFSPCTIGNICSALGRDSVISSCLVDNRNVTTIRNAQCGNGIVEDGEDCDCGGDELCSENPCCNPSTCRFRNSAVCDDSNESCCSNCQFLSRDTVCRPSTGPCDTEELCTGLSGFCPTDNYQPDGQSCGDNTGLSCASGQCTSRDLQCQTAVDQSTNSNYTRACERDSCTLSCSYSEYTRSYCASVDQNYLNGTPCNSGGRCSDGQCQGTSPGNDSSSWVDNHRSLIIGLAAGLGTLVLLIFGCSIFACCRRHKHEKCSIPATQSSQPSMSQHLGAPLAYPIPAQTNLIAQQSHVSPVRYA